MKRKVILLGCCLLLAGGLAGCDKAAAGMNADTTCRDFLQATRDDQNAAIARVADEVGARDALTPLGRPNIDYLCSQDQDLTLGDAVESTG